MTQRKSYSRYFIILQEDEKGYELASDKLPNGYAKLETKNGRCKISFYVQNLKKQMKPYYMVLICGKKKVNKLINIGEIKLDDYGRVDTTVEYPLENIAQTDVAMDKISGAAIVKLNSNRITCIMNGFITKEASKNWKQYDILKPRKEEVRTQQVKTEEVKKEEKIKIDEAKTPKVKKDEISEKEHTIETAKFEKHSVDLNSTRDSDSKEVKDEKNIFDEYEKNIEKNKLNETEDKETENKDKVSKSAFNDIKKQTEISDNKDINENINEEEYRNEFEYNEYPRGSTGNFFKGLVEEFEEVKGVIKDIKKCKWYKVVIEKPEDIYNMVNYKKYTVVYYPMMTYYPYISKYGHYLLGYKWDSKGEMKYIIYAIPGTKKEQPYGGQSGFVTWIPKNKDDDMGYWIMFYDFKDCTIAIPVKK